ncbi:hypothetical protein ACFTTN_36000 [Streptomyces niveus]|uniref:hypothetical protein n=1 Tax=Streptomyces niveus TaxID=193462 RepID=UPI0036313169
MSVSRLNTLPLNVAAVLDDGTPDAITIQPGDAYIHIETGVILAFVLSDNQGARFLFALDHADQSKEPLREVIHVLRDSWFFRNLVKATPVGRAVRVGGFLLRHFWNWSKEPAGTGYYQQPNGNLIFAGTYQLEPH